jgi:serine/threonine protein kinase
VALQQCDFGKCVAQPVPTLLQDCQCTSCDDATCGTPPPTPKVPSLGGGGSGSGAAIGGSLSAVVLIAAAVFGIKKRRAFGATTRSKANNSESVETASVEMLQNPGLSDGDDGEDGCSAAAGRHLPVVGTATAAATAQEFTSEQLAACTSNFRNELGKGAFGAVFGGVLPDRRRVAVKQMSLEATVLQEAAGGSGAEPAAAAAEAPVGAQKFTGEAGFRRELEMLGRCAHANIVLLFGYCIERRAVGTSTFGLVLEYMPGGSLLDALAAGRSRQQPALAAAPRLDVASDVARGLHYLHTEALLVHQDVKSDNVLLAFDGNSGRVVAKVADFGTARVVPKQAMQAHHSTRVVIGTTPYMPMEYMQCGHVSEKTDTYAFGVVLCELLTGKPPVDGGTGEMLASQMQLMLRQPEAALLPQLLDARAGAWPSGGAMSLARMAQRCIHPFAHDRCTVRDVIGAVDALAGRAPTPPHHTTVALRPELSTRTSALPLQGGSTAPTACPHCGAKLRYREGTALPCFTCKYKR